MILHPVVYQKENTARVKLVTSTRVSTNKDAKQLSYGGIDIPTLSQVAIYKSIFKEAVKLKEEMIAKLQTEQMVPILFFFLWQAH